MDFSCYFSLYFHQQVQNAASGSLVETVLGVLGGIIGLYTVGKYISCCK